VTTVVFIVLTAVATGGYGLHARLYDANVAVLQAEKGALKAQNETLTATYAADEATLRAEKGTLQAEKGTLQAQKDLAEERAKDAERQRSEAITDDRALARKEKFVSAYLRYMLAKENQLPLTDLAVARKALYDMVHTLTETRDDVRLNIAQRPGESTITFLSDLTVWPLPPEFNLGFGTPP
jgi:hypothetical protein